MWAPHNGPAFGSPRRTTGATVAERDMPCGAVEFRLRTSGPDRPGHEENRASRGPVYVEFLRCIRSEGGPMNQRELIRPDATIRYWTGGPDTAPTLMLLHGATLDHQAWDPQVDAL